MDKDEKQGFLIQIRLKEIEAINRDYTQFFIKMSFGIFVVVAFLFSIGVFDKSNLFVPLILLILYFLLFIWIGEQINKYIEDLYDALFDSIKKNNIDNFYILKIQIFDGFYYRKKFKSLLIKK